MPRPRMTDVENTDPNVGVEPEDANVTGSHVGDVTVMTDAGTASVASTSVDSNSNASEVKKPRGAKRLKVADDTFGLLQEPVKADIPKRTSSGRGRGRTVDPRTVKTIEMLKQHPGETFLIGRYSAAASAEGLWKQNGISFSSVAVEITNTDGEPVKVFDRYATYTPGTEVEPGEAAEQPA